MRWLALVVALCACDRVLGLGAAISSDAADSHGPFYDAHLAIGCPPIGTTPQYSPILVQGFVQNCSGYTIDGARQVALARCVDDVGQSFDAFAPVGTLMSRALGLDDSNCSNNGGVTQLARNGDAYRTCYYPLDGTYEYRTYQQQADQMWTRGPDVIAASVQFSFVPAPSGVVAPHHLVFLDAFDQQLHELVGDLGAWTDTGRPVTSATLGLASILWMRLSADGLRMTLYATTSQNPQQIRALYTDRPTVDDAFRIAEPMPGVPDAVVEMTDDCTHVYMSGLGSIFYVEEIVPP